MPQDCRHKPWRPSSTLLPFFFFFFGGGGGGGGGLGSLINPFKQKKGTLFKPRSQGSLVSPGGLFVWALAWHMGKYVSAMCLDITEAPSSEFEALGFLFDRKNQEGARNLRKEGP